MKKVYFFLFFALSFISNSIAQTAFTTGNLVVYKVGNGADTLSNAGIAAGIDEYTTGGAYVRSHPLPVALSGANRRIIASGTATTEGQITRSTDKHFLIVTGYDTFPDPVRLGINNSIASDVNRVVGVLGANGALDASTALGGDYSGSNIRGAVSTDGMNIWVAGTGNPSATLGGVRYITKGGAASVQLSTTPNPTNIRAVNIFNDQLYITTGSGAFKAISTVGTGLPTTAGQTCTVLSGMEDIGGINPDPNAFAIQPGTAAIAYVADSRSKSNGGGIQKWVYNAGTWSLSYTLDSGLTTGLRNLVVDWSTPAPTIYCVNGDSYMKDMPGNKIVVVTDVDSTSQFTELATAASNYMFRGIAFAPEPTATGTTYTFTGNGNWNVAANWANNQKPPSPLPAGSAIIIDHALAGECVLNIEQQLAAGSSFTVNAGKNLLIQGSLTIQ